jgi:hypothetical protein
VLSLARTVAGDRQEGACAERSVGAGDMEALPALEAGSEAAVVAVAVDAVWSGHRLRTRRSAAAALGRCTSKALLAAPPTKLLVVALALLVASGECRGGGVPAGSAAAYLYAPSPPSCDGRNRHRRGQLTPSWRRMTTSRAPPSSSAAALSSSSSGALFSFGSFHASRRSLAGWGCAAAVQILPPGALRVPQQQRHGRRPGGSIERRATVYAPPWESSSSSESSSGVADPDDDSDLSYYSSTSDEDHHVALKSLISRTEASAAMLARLAVAFSPASRTLDIKDIEHVQVLEVDNKHLDIQAVICEDDGCVTLKVPVPFPVPCVVGDRDTEEDEEHCVLSNLHRLDLQAQETIRILEWNEVHHEDVAAKHRMRKELLREATGGGGDDVLHFPTWWVYPSSTTTTSDELRRACDGIRKLLNDDEFRSAVASLATQAMDAASAAASTDDDDEETTASSMSYEDFHVEQAVVAAVGPKGLLLRAAVAPLEILGGHNHNNARGHVLEIPVQFSSAARSADELQSAVLSLVAAAEEYGG